MLKECQSRPFRGNLMFKDQIHDDGKLWVKWFFFGKFKLYGL